MSDLDRKLSRRSFVRFAAGVLGAGALAACGATPTPTPVPTKPAAAPAATAGPTKAAAPAATAVPPAASGPGVKIVCWHIWSGGRIQLMDDMFARFNKANPGITASHEFISGSSTQLLQKLQTSMAAGQPPDVAMSFDSWVPAFAIRKSLVPLDELVKADGVDLGVFFEFRLTSARWDGKLYVLPTDGSSHPLFLYRTDHYTESGLKPDAPPKTWDDLITTSKALVRFEGGKVTRMGMDWAGTYADIADLAYLTYSNNGKLMSDDGRKFFLNSPEAVEAMEFVVRLTNEVYGGPKPYQELTTYQAGLAIGNPFQAGISSQGMHGAFVVGLIETGNIPMKYMAAPPPASSKGQPHAVYIQAWTYGIPTAAPNRQASWKLLKWLTIEPSAAGWFMAQQLRVPALKASMSDPSLTKFPAWQGVLAQNATAVGFTLPPVWAEMSTIVNRNLEAIFAGDVKPKAGLDTAQAEAQKLSDEFHAQNK